jgi:hypothetical protein
MELVCVKYGNGKHQPTPDAGSLVNYDQSDLVIYYVVLNYLNKRTNLYWTKNCTCNWWTSYSKRVEFIKINDSRTEIRCGRRHGLMGWVDESTRAKKIAPLKRSWSYKERLAMR